MNIDILALCDFALRNFASKTKSFVQHNKIKLRKSYPSGEFPFSPTLDLDSQKKGEMPYPRCGFGA